MAAELRAFISYVRQDAKAVDRIQEALEAAGIPVWRDVHSLGPGEDWEDQVRRAIEDDALAFIACFSAASEARDRTYQREEIVLAVEQMRLRAPNRPWFIPVRLSDCEIPRYKVRAGRTLASYQAVDLFGPGRAKAMARLVDAVRRLMPPVEAPEPPTPRQLEPWDDRDWRRLVEQLETGECTPFLGPDVSSPPLPTEAELAGHWAADYDLPTGPEATLAEVMAAAYGIERDRVTVKNRFTRHLAGLGEPDYTDPAEPHALFARLPITAVLTTKYDDFMTRALQRRGKQPVTTVCPWYDWAEDDPLTTAPRGYRPSPDRPLVFHLHGSLHRPAWLVLAEPDDLDFQKALAGDLEAGRRRLLPTHVLAALTRHPLLFLGYDLADRRYQRLFTALAAGFPDAFRRRHYLVHAPSPDAKSFLETQTPDLSIYWATVPEFCTELTSRLPPS